MALFGILEFIKGPEFLAIYGAWWLIVFIGVLLLRRKGYEHGVTAAWGLAMFLGVGLFRIVDGESHGMHRWGFLVLMMFVGAVLLSVRAESGGDGTSWGGSGCSSSCGGGGGSGGGCGGGCGGCGG